MITDNTAKWRKKKLTNFASNNAMPVGHIYQSLSKNVPVGSLPLLGGTYDRSLYADLWSWANENGLVVSESEWQEQALAQGGSCSKFSEGNGSTTFRVPALKCWVKGAGGVEEVGGYLEAGLPNIDHTHTRGTMNITGDLTITADANNAGMDATGTGTGAFTSNSTKGSGSSPDATDWTVWSGFSFDASKSWTGETSTNSEVDSVYGNSNTVQPPSIVAMYCIVAYGTITNSGNVDIEHFINELEQVKVDVSTQAIELGNVKADVSTQATELGNVKAEAESHFNSSGHLVLPDGSEFWIA